MLDLVLAAAGGVVVGFVAAKGISRLSRETAQRAAQDRWDCRCGQTYWSEQPAKEHAIETHNAPSQDGEWRFLYEVHE